MENWQHVTNHTLLGPPAEGLEFRPLPLAWYVRTATDDDEQVLHAHRHPSLTLLSIPFKSDRQPEEISSHFKVKERRANSKSKRILEMKKQKSNASVEGSGNIYLRVL